MLVEFRRHSIKDGATTDVIGSKGFELARAVGRTQLRGRRFTHYAVSELWRTGQTMAGFDEGAGDFTLKHGPLTAPFNLKDARARAIFTGIQPADQAGLDLFQTALALDRKTVDWMARKLAQLFRKWAGQFGRCDRVLVVNHSPSAEILAYGLTGIIMPSLRECEGFRLRYGPKTVRLEHGSRDLGSSRAFAALNPDIKIDRRRSFKAMLAPCPRP